MVAQHSKQAAHRALVDRVLNGAGRTSADQRAHAFSNTGNPAPVDALLAKVATRPTQVTDADFAAALASGFTEDQLFELVVSTAVGHAARQYAAGLAALAEVTDAGRPGSAT